MKNDILKYILKYIFFSMRKCMMNFAYNFPSVRGFQAGNEYYISMIPLKLLSKIFISKDDFVPPEFRAQRQINEVRIPEIKDYILKNRETYVFSALSASIDGDFEFLPINGNDELGILKISMDSIFLINDGQHRKAAIETALQECPELGEETISIVFFKDKGLARSQQMFTDLNKHAVRTSNSLATLYDYRDETAVITRDIINRNKFFSRYTDKEKDILGANSSKLFTLQTIYKANDRILHNTKNNNEVITFVRDYWKNLTDNIVEWNELMNGEITKRSLRQDYILCLAITINAFGKLGKFFLEKKIDLEKLNGLRKIDWSRTNKGNWLNRVIRNDGKVISNEEAVTLTYIQIKKLLGLSLSSDESAKDNCFREGK